MLTWASTVRVFVVVAPFNMRGSFDALAGAVRSLGLEPTDGHLYLFLNKSRRIAKAIWFDGSGWGPPADVEQVGERLLLLAGLVQSSSA